MLRRLEERIIQAILRRLMNRRQSADPAFGWQRDGTFACTALVEFGPTHHREELDIELYDGSCTRIDQEQAAALSTALWRFARTGEFRPYRAGERD
jgi:predicted component of type VI protein secretion system